MNKKGIVKVSIIIPVYGVEKYIERCARSLFSQTLDEIEYIFVDDGTLDNSLLVLERVIQDYPQRKEQITIIHHEKNKGLPVARETGSKHACGEYLAHCDSDDWVDPDMYKTLYEYATTGGYDLVTCNIIREGENGRELLADSSFGSKTRYFTGLLRKTNQPMVWNKIYKRDLNCLIDYPKYSMGEDLVTSIQIAYYASSIGYCQQPLYHYYTHQQSLTKVSTSEDITYNKFLQVLSNGDQLFSFLSHNNLDKEFSNEIVYSKLMKKAFLIPLLNKDNYRSIWLNTYPEIRSKVLFNPIIPLREKLRYLYYSTLVRLQYKYKND